MIRLKIERDYDISPGSVLHDIIGVDSSVLEIEIEIDENHMNIEDVAVGPHKAYCFDHSIGKKLLRQWWRDQYGYLHKLDGPAVKWENGRHEWWYHGTRLDVESQEEFERALKLKVFW